MRRPITIGSAVALLWLAVSLGPRLVAGESWGMVWFPMNEPLSGWAEQRWGIGSASYGLVAGVTLVNALVVGAIVAGGAWLVRRSRARQPR